ncbi:MAG: hypothetical protein AAFU78_22500 [Cyanobacteria bacterium J06633_2]
MKYFAIQLFNRWDASTRTYVFKQASYDVFTYSMAIAATFVFDSPPSCAEILKSFDADSHTWYCHEGMWQVEDCIEISESDFYGAVRPNCHLLQFSDITPSDEWLRLIDSALNAGMPV